MKIATFDEYRGYTGSIEIRTRGEQGLKKRPHFNPNKIQSDFNDETSYTYYGKILDVKRDNIYYSAYTLESLHRRFQHIVDNYIAHNEGFIRCEDGRDEICDYRCEHCSCKEQPILHSCQFNKEILCTVREDMCNGNSCKHFLTSESS